MTSEIKENEIDTSNEGVTHLEFVGDRASDYDYELSVSGENITLLENFLELACNKQKTSYTSSLRSLKIMYYSRLSDNKILCVLRSYPNITSLNFEQINLVQYLWLTYANLEDIVQYCKDKIKDEHYQKSIVELERDMRGMAKRFGLMVRIYGFKEKINYQLTNPELDTNYAITEFIPHDIKYR
ncbi:1083_t:CDS:2, partial [Funneliformis caledonium]